MSRTPSKCHELHRNVTNSIEMSQTPSKCHELHRNVTNSIIQMSLTRSSKLIITSTHHDFKMRNESHRFNQPRTLSSTNSIIQMLSTRSSKIIDAPSRQVYGYHMGYHIHHMGWVLGISYPMWYLYATHTATLSTTHEISHTSHGLSPRYFISHVISVCNTHCNTLCNTWISQSSLYCSNITNSVSRKECWMNVTYSLIQNAYTNCIL